jgi:hypothetical protein
MHPAVEMPPVIKPGAAYRLIIKPEAERSYEV